MPRGFVLHPTYYIENGRPVVHLFGRLDSGETFVVMDDRARPQFFIREAELPAALRVAPCESHSSPFTTTQGEPVVRISTGVPPDLAQLRDRLQASGVKTFEADVPFVTR